MLFIIYLTCDEAWWFLTTRATALAVAAASVHANPAGRAGVGN